MFNTIEADDAYQIANAFAQVSARILDFRVRSDDLAEKQRIELERCEDTIDALVVLFRGYGIQQLALGAADDAVELRAAIDDARDALKRIADVKRAITIAASVVNLAVAVQTGNVKAVVTALAAMKSTVSGEED